MKKLSATLLMFLLATVALVGCKKDPAPEPEPEPEPVYDYKVTTNHSMGDYQIDPAVPGLANYVLVLSEMTVDLSNFTFEGVGCALGLNIYAKPNASMMLPDGRYNFVKTGGAIADMSMMAENSFFIVVSKVEEEFAPDFFEYSDATIDVSHNADVLTIVVKAKTAEGKSIHSTFVGKIEMRNITEPAGSPLRKLVRTR